MLRGQVFKIIAGYYDVYCEGKIYRVRGAGNLRHQTKSPLVGDFVSFTSDQFIHDIYPRKNQLIRPKVANVDQVVIVISLAEPSYAPLLLNRMLAIVEAQNIHPLILFTKSDLVTFDKAKQYQKQGYEAYVISNQDLKSLEQIQNCFANKLTVFAGQSGVGKSTTIANLTKIARETQAISKSLGRGKHTTRVVEIIPWNRGWLIDTPGFSSLKMELTPVQLAQAFHDFRIYSRQCKFNDCLHLVETKCQIKKLVDKQVIDQERYQTYVRLQGELQDE